ncbi:acyl-CoA N-acyltransferase [Hypoxylon cercidicola]|nr:acyl-CoA N-acyltransferase [Hypoxylon cercidicola]
MPLGLRPADGGDARRAAEIEWAAYAPNPFNRILFPGPFSPEASSSTCWSKVVDTGLPEDPEQTVAFAKWHVYAQSPRPTNRKFGAECNVEACELLFGGIVKQRVRILGDRPYYCHSLYIKCGFHDVECLSIDFSKWGAPEKHNTWSVICNPPEAAAK